jgi:cytochrome c biogenesis protein ResB
MEKGAQTFRAGGKDYRMSLRFTRTYKPYSLYLSSFRFERYSGTDTPKDYSSNVKLEDPERSVVRDVRIWMNNPLRYRGDTLYQSSFDAETEKGTVLQVVENRGWMAPYVGCMIVAVGLLGQFLLHLMGFLRKRMESAA